MEAAEEPEGVGEAVEEAVEEVVEEVVEQLDEDRGDAPDAGVAERDLAATTTSTTAKHSVRDTTVSPHKPSMEGVSGRGLLIGINYVNQEDALQDSISNAHSTRAAFRDEGFGGELRVIADDGSIDCMPTRSNIEIGMDWLVRDSQPGEGLVLYYCGHTALDENGRLLLKPADHRTQGCLSVPELYNYFERNLPVGSRLLWIIDSKTASEAKDAHAFGVQCKLVSHKGGVDEETRPPGGAWHQMNGDVVVVTTSQNVGPDAPPLGPLVAEVLSGLATSGEGHVPTHLETAAALFIKKAHERYPGVLDKLEEGGYTANDYATWATKGLTDLQ
eukprot:Sspe_Gene.101119::Locus_75706_Transcript_1_1_Confidence_1.000_Length_1073::g.101119::m.101119